MCFNEDWRYQFTPDNNFSLLEMGSRRQRSIPLGGRYRQVLLYHDDMDTISASEKDARRSNFNFYVPHRSSFNMNNNTYSINL